VRSSPTTRSAGLPDAATLIADSTEGCELQRAGAVSATAWRSLGVSYGISRCWQAQVGGQDGMGVGAGQQELDRDDARGRFFPTVRGA
jgi:hypothetical protein